MLRSIYNELPRDWVEENTDSPEDLPFVPKEDYHRLLYGGYVDEDTLTSIIERIFDDWDVMQKRLSIPKKVLEELKSKAEKPFDLEEENICKDYFKIRDYDIQLPSFEYEPQFDYKRLDITIENTNIMDKILKDAFNLTEYNSLEEVLKNISFKTSSPRIGLKLGYGISNVGPLLSYNLSYVDLYNNRIYDFEIENVITLVKNIMENNGILVLTNNPIVSNKKSFKLLVENLYKHNIPHALLHIIWIPKDYVEKEKAWINHVSNLGFLSKKIKDIHRRFYL